MTRRLHVLQHVDFEGPGHIGWWAMRQGHKLTGTLFHEGDSLPALDEVDALVVMGGPMSVHDEDEHPWLVEEKAYLERAIEERIPLLGVCLGAQLIADVLGGEVSEAKHREIGWFPVEVPGGTVRHPAFDHVPSRFEAFHWHEETYSLPKGAVRQATSESGAEQAFAYDEHVLAIQFHLEIDPSTITQLARNSPGDLDEGPFVQSVSEMVDDPDRFRQAHTRMQGLLDGWQTVW